MIKNYNSQKNRLIQPISTNNNNKFNKVTPNNNKPKNLHRHHKRTTVTRKREGNQIKIITKTIIFQ